MSRGRDRKRAIRAVEAALVDAEQTIALALSRIRAVRLPEEDDGESPRPPPESPVVHH